jgi:hypothetical protein
VRRQDTDAERRAFLDRLHVELFGKGLDALQPDTLVTVTRTMADAAILSDDDLLRNYREAGDRVPRLMDEAEVGDTPEERRWVTGAAERILRAVLQREMELRGLGGRGVINGMTRANALEVL